MTTAYLVSVSALFFGAGAAAAWKLTALHYRSRLSEAMHAKATYKAWWERDSGKMLIAQAELDLIAEQRRAAGRQSHKAERALFVDTALWLSDQPIQPLRPRAEIEAEVAAVRAARKIQSDAANPAPGFPAQSSAAARTGGRGKGTPHHTGQDTGAGALADVTLRASTGNEPGRSCGRNRAGHSASAEFSPEAKGASHG